MKRQSPRLERKSHASFQTLQRSCVLMGEEEESFVVERWLKKQKRGVPIGQAKGFSCGKGKRLFGEECWRGEKRRSEIFDVAARNESFNKRETGERRRTSQLGEKKGGGH